MTSFVAKLLQPALSLISRGWENVVIAPTPVQSPACTSVFFTLVCVIVFVYVAFQNSADCDRKFAPPLFCPPFIPFPVLTTWH